MSEDFAVRGEHPRHPSRPWYEAASRGDSLALASGTQPIKRATAERIVQKFLERVRQVNSDPQYLYWVESVDAFGSYLTDAPKLGDVDLLVRLKPRISDPQHLQEATIS